MAYDFAFRPSGDTVNINVAATTANVKVDLGQPSVRICNLGTATVWIKFGGSTVEATTSDLPIPANGFTEVLIPRATGADNILYVAAIAAGSTGRIYFTPGDGM